MKKRIHNHIYSLDLSLSSPAALPRSPSEELQPPVLADQVPLPLPPPLSWEAQESILPQVHTAQTPTEREKVYRAVFNANIFQT